MTLGKSDKISSPIPICNLYIEHQESTWCIISHVKVPKSSFNIIDDKKLWVWVFSLNIMWSFSIGFQTYRVYYRDKEKVCPNSSVMFSLVTVDDTGDSCVIVAILNITTWFIVNLEWILRSLSQKGCVCNCAWFSEIWWQYVIIQHWWLSYMRVQARQRGCTAQNIFSFYYNFTWTRWSWVLWVTCDSVSHPVSIASLLKSCIINVGPRSKYGLHSNIMAYTKTICWLYGAL